MQRGKNIYLRVLCSCVFLVEGAQRETAKAKDVAKTFAGMIGGDAAGLPNRLNNIDVDDQSRSGPFFDKAASKNVTALLGKTAYLICKVKNLGNKTVSINQYINNFLSVVL